MEGNARTSHEPERQHARQSSPGAGLPAAYPRKSSPNAAPPAAFPRKSSPNAPENSVFRPFWACGANFFALTHRSGRAGRTFSRPARQLLEIKTFKAMTTHSHCPRETDDTTARLREHVVETDDTTARLPELTNETAITIASPQHPKNQHFPRAKVSPVSSRRSDALDTAPMHQIAQHCTGN